MFLLNNAADVMNGNYPFSYRQDRKLPFYRSILGSRSLGINAHGQFLCCHPWLTGFLYFLSPLPSKPDRIALCNDTMSIYPLGLICLRYLFTLKEGKNWLEEDTDKTLASIFPPLKKIRWTLRICEHVFSMNDSLIHSPCYVFTEARFLVMENSLWKLLRAQQVQNNKI